MLFKNLYITFTLLLTVITHETFARTEVSLGLDPVPNQINAVRFDPSYYYDSPLKIDDMSNELAGKWRNFGVNTIFFKAYDPIYGAKYKTSYDLNIIADYGKQDLLKHMLRACSKNDIQVIAWIPAFQHKAAWEKHPGWRVKSADGTDYKPTDYSYFLCPANPAVRQWWLGFLKDLLKRYKEVDGIDIAEPIINWKGNRCFCNYCRQSSENIAENIHHNITSEGLTETLNSSIKLIHEFNKIACITTVASVHQDGRILTTAEQMNLTGLDLDNILNEKDKPDWINVELMWQQWADKINNEKIFTPEWTKQAAKAIIRQIDDRATVIGHLEMTSFGHQRVDAAELSKSILATKAGGIEHIDLYDTHLIDNENAWETVEEAFAYVPTKNILVYYDPLGENDARQVVSLLSHFKTNVTLEQLTHDYDLSQGNIQQFDIIFYMGVDPKFTLPTQFLTELAHYSETICWIQHGVDQFLNIEEDNHYGFHYEKTYYDSAYNIVKYNKFSLPKLDPSFNVVSITDTMKCHQIASLTNGIKTLPYALRSGNFWYFTDLPTAFVTEGGRHIVFSDLLHEIVREDHHVRKLALVRIEDISPLTDIESLERIANYLKSRHVPFSISLVPFYLDPETNTAVAMSDRPDFVDAIKHMIKSGGTVVMHGSTHQYRGETTADYEFWDNMSGGPIFSDSKEYVRQRLITGLTEFGKNRIYPLVWETPHYGASQLDYSIINTFFSTSYERRQTIDLHGSDQLLPYLIEKHTSGGKIIPENLGYIPLAQPDAAQIIQAATNNLAIRDGVASFFFHPFVDISVLKDLITGLKQLDYTFISPSQTSNWVKAPDYVVLSGRGQIELNLNDDYCHEFFIDEKGSIEQEVYSDSTILGTFSKHVTVPDGWIYVAERLSTKPAGFFATTINKITPSIPRFSKSIWGKEKPLEDPDATPLDVAILYDDSVSRPLANDQANLVKSLRSVGVDASIIDVRDFLEVPNNINLMIVPYAAARSLNEQQNLFLIHALQSGLNLIIEKNSRLSESIGISPVDNVVMVNEVVDEYFPQVGIKWKEADSLQEFNVNIEYVTYYSDKKSELPVAIGGEYGEGKYLYFATLFDPFTDSGYGRFPYFIDLLKRQFSLVPAIRRNAVEVYFEPGDREEISIEELVKVWRSNGVRRIYVSAWHFYKNYTYDYERLIRLAHQNAMLVYAWLELPHVNEKFWNDHPEWREKTATLQDAKVDWRRHMALNIESCRQAVFDELLNVLTNYSWDGVNLAELYYESQHGYRNPDIFTPMNNDIRKTFAQQSGFDPRLLFKANSQYYWKRNPAAVDAFNQFREDQIVQLHAQFLKFLFKVKKDNNLDWEIVVTTIDNVLSPKTGKGTAVNTLRIVELTKTFPFTLQIEDPQALWPLGPIRYTKILEAYSDIREKIPLILDINVVPYRNMSESQAPTHQPTGIELFNLARAAGMDQTRVAFYSEASIYEVDFPLVPHVMAVDAIEEKTGDIWTIESPYTVNFMIDADVHSDVLVDGNIWPAYYRGRVLIPAGKHTIRPFSNVKGLINRFKSNTRLIDLSGELKSANTISRGIKFEYKSSQPNFVILTDDPKEVLLDGKQFDPETLKGDLGFSIRLPAGDHVVTVYTQSNSTQFMRHASILLSGMIVFIGFSAGTLLTIIYVRNFYRRKHKLI
ncbi:MAG: DUF2334 domain-containing protein [bacterium]|nr:MAG: DUF2334 domain-containing protein [bacterium]